LLSESDFQDPAQPKDTAPNFPQDLRLQPEPSQDRVNAEFGCRLKPQTRFFPGSGDCRLLCSFSSPKIS
jgi:hypothetical protein